MNSSIDIQCKITALRELPPPPAAARQILAALMNDDLDLRELSDLVARHPTLTARILGLARSAFFARGKPVTSIKEAIIRVLGLRLVKCIAVAVATTGQMKTERCPSFDGERYWQHALIVAFMSRSLCRSMAGADRPDPDDAYLQGLLCDFGVLALAHAIPLEMDQVFRAAEQGPARLHEIEQAQFHATHGEAGSWVGKRWHLPESTCAVMAHHADPDYRGDYWINSAVVGLCTLWLHDRATAQTLWQDDARLPTLGICAQDVEQVGLSCLERVGDITQLAGVFAGK